MNYDKFLTPFWVKREKEIEDSLAGDYSRFWDDPYVSHAMIMNGHYLGTVVSHIRHLGTWEEKTGKNLRHVKSIIEFGGGFGSMCRLIRGYNRNPYTIIDIPVINNIQKYFLREDSGVQYVGLDKLEETELDCELFISTFALTEASLEAVKYVVDNNFFGAKHLLIAFYTKNNDAFKVEELLPLIAEHGTQYPFDDHHNYLIR